MAAREPLTRPDEGRWVGDPQVFHGEGAFWDAAAGALRSVDMLAGDVITTTSGEASTSGRTHVSDVVALIRRRSRGGYVAAVERGFALLDDDLRIERSIPVFDDESVRMNEGACDARGRLFVGSMAYDVRAGGGVLYRLDPDLSVHVALPSVTVPNGLVWTDDGGTALHADTAAREIRAYDYDPESGVFGASRVHIAFPDSEPGAPDGMALDTDGGLWVAMWGGAAVHRYDPAGRLDEVVRLPVTNPTSCAFGGDDGSLLYVTTSRQSIDPGTEEYAGRIHTVPTGVVGAPVHDFSG
jgi:sugar lactone lactonase YvrE